MKKALIITYYWPPSGGVGVQRWLKFVKYLPENGWQSIVFTPEAPDFELKDERLLADIPQETEVLKFPIWEPFKLLNYFRSAQKSPKLQQGTVLEKDKQNWKDKMIVWLRGNLFIPDARMFWIRPSAGFLSRFLDESPVDMIITTGPPHSVHLIGKTLHKKTGIPWLADFRDPWSQWDLLSKLRVGKLAQFIHNSLEAKVLKNANVVLTVSDSMAKDFKRLGARHTEVITNGVDLEQLSINNIKIRQDRFEIAYYGLLNEMRNPLPFWEVLEDWLTRDEERQRYFSLKIAGIMSDALQQKMQVYPILYQHFTFGGYLPQQAIMQNAGKASVLLLLSNNTGNANQLIPAKLFEYLATGRPILYIGSLQSEPAKIIHKHAAGWVIDSQDKQTMSKVIESAYDQWKSGNLATVQRDLQAYDRRELAKRLATIMNKFSSTGNAQ